MYMFTYMVDNSMDRTTVKIGNTVYMNQSRKINELTFHFHDIILRIPGESSKVTCKEFHRTWYSNHLS